MAARTRSQTAARPLAANRARKNSLGDFFKSRVYPWRSSAGQARSSSGRKSGSIRFKGYRISQNAEGEWTVPELDRGSTFESKTEAKRFVNYWAKKNRGRAVMKKKRKTPARENRVPKVKALKGSTGWMAATRVKIVRGRGGDTVLVQKPRRKGARR